MIQKKPGAVLQSLPAHRSANCELRLVTLESESADLFGSGRLLPTVQLATTADAAMNIHKTLAQLDVQDSRRGRRRQCRRSPSGVCRYPCCRIECACQWH